MGLNIFRIGNLQGIFIPEILLKHLHVRQGWEGKFNQWGKGENQ